MLLLTGSCRLALCPPVSPSTAPRTLYAPAQAACAAAWRQFLRGFADCYPTLRGACTALAALDCLRSLAAVASTPGYTRPELLADDQPPQLHIEDGR